MFVFAVYKDHTEPVHAGAQVAEYFLADEADAGVDPAGQGRIDGILPFLHSLFTLGLC